MIRKLYILSVMLLTVVCIYAENPLNEYVSDQVYLEGIRKFPSGEDVFKTQVYSLEGVDKGREEAIAKIKSTFAEVSAVTGTNTNWVTSFYYNEGSTKKRKTAMGTETIRIGDSSYSVSAYSQGIRVRDLKSGYEATIEKKERGAR